MGQAAGYNPGNPYCGGDCRRVIGHRCGVLKLLIIVVMSRSGGGHSGDIVWKP